MADPVVFYAGSGSIRRLPTHRNAGLELVYVERGELLWHIGGVRYRVTAGSVFYTFPWEDHGSLREFEPGHRWHFLIANVGGARAVRGRRADPTPVFGRNSAAGRAALDALARATERCLPASGHLAFLLRAAAAEFGGDSRSREDVLRCIARWSLFDLARSLPAARREKNPVAANAAVRQFLKSLPERLEQGWTLAGMAGDCGLGRTQFANTVRILTGDTPMEHLRRLRIERARRRLRDTGDGITDIAMECGFASSQHFARIFKIFTGQSASAYRGDVPTPNAPARDKSAKPAKTGAGAKDRRG
jgi:AraC family L-rhamnose operon regulatory protein RhaS